MKRSIHHDDDDLEILPKEGSISTNESKWCVFCSDNSRNVRKRNTCNTYEESNTPVKMSKTFRKVLRDYRPHTPHNRIIIRIECMNCHSQACVPCVKEICKAMENGKVSENDKWYHDVRSIIATNKIPTTFIGHCCEVRKK